MVYNDHDSGRVTVVRGFDRTLRMDAQGKEERIIPWASGLGYAGEE